jgi:hypothetical protein
LEDGGPAGICCAAPIWAALGGSPGEQVEMGRFSRYRRLRPAGVLVAASLAGCAALPAWTGLQVPDREDSAGGPVVYPDLTQIPDRPAPVDTAQQRQEAVQTLTADRARVAQAGTDLRHEIDTGFQQPEPLPGP